MQNCRYSGPTYHSRLMSDFFEGAMLQAYTKLDGINEYEVIFSLCYRESLNACCTNVLQSVSRDPISPKSFLVSSYSSTSDEGLKTGPKTIF